MTIDEIMIIDDDKATNYLSKYILDDLNCCNKISVFQLPIEALAELETRINQKNNLPNVVLLDLNMPKMNGWEFLDKYEAFSKKNSLAKPHIFILSTSMNPEDKKRANEIDSVSAFYKKPVSKELITTIYQKHLQS